MEPTDPDAQAELEAWTERAFADLEAAGGDPERLGEPSRTIVVITACQGVIDNGGLRFFFENDWPGLPPYRSIADTYRRIGATGTAEAVEAATGLFPFPQPETDCERRRAALAGPVGAEIDALTPSDDDIWMLLAQHLRTVRREHSNGEA